jgi:hypothetical protein
MRTTIKAMVLAALLATSVTARSQTAPFDMAKLKGGVDQLAVMAADGIMSRGDVNRDGAITHAEAVRLGQRMGRPGGPDPRTWTTLDINKDGVISRREFIETFRVVMARTGTAQQPF